MNEQASSDPPAEQLAVVQLPPVVRTQQCGDISGYIMSLSSHSRPSSTRPHKAILRMRGDKADCRWNLPKFHKGTACDTKRWSPNHEPVCFIFNEMRSLQECLLNTERFTKRAIQQKRASFFCQLSFETDGKS